MLKNSSKPTSANTSLTIGLFHSKLKMHTPLLRNQPLESGWAGVCGHVQLETVYHGEMGDISSTQVGEIVSTQVKHTAKYNIN
jgi:hypothetical protein